MTLERILDAAINSMVRGHHAAHCFSAHVQGKGYVNKGELETDRADYLAQLERAARCEADNIGFAPDYAEPGYDKPAKGVLFADWNKFPLDFDRVLEKAGYSVEWSDEWSTCEDCQRAIRTEPSSYGWKPSYVLLGDSTIVCRDCLLDNIDTYEEHLLNNCNVADTFDVDWTEHGFERLSEYPFESGLHPGQTDKPKEIVKLVPKGHDYLFSIGAVGQFDVRFNCWIRKQEEE